MEWTVRSFFTPSTTAKEILKSANYTEDLGDLVEMTLPQFFNYVKNIPYEQDMEFLEVVERPKYLLDKSRSRRIDCKKKATLIASWLLAHGYEWVSAPEKATSPRSFVFVALSEAPDGLIHHIFPALVENGFITPLDATYQDFEIGQGKPYATEARFIP